MVEIGEGADLFESGGRMAIPAWHFDRAMGIPYLGLGWRICPEEADPHSDNAGKNQNPGNDSVSFEIWNRMARITM